MTKLELREGIFGELTYLFRPAGNKDKPSILLLHGLSGDESSMWVLEHALPSGGLIAAPRGIYPHALGGYSWLPGPLSGWPSLKDFQPTVQSFQYLLDDLESHTHFDRERVALVGFSQGSALAFAIAVSNLLHPIAIVAVAGFLPEGEVDSLEHTPIFWGHGSQDKIVPPAQAQLGIHRLQEIGARVEYCQADVGHKLGLECTRGLKYWWQNHVFPEWE
jgi:predicted esterase